MEIKKIKKKPLKRLDTVAEKVFIENMNKASSDHNTENQSLTKIVLENIKPSLSVALLNLPLSLTGAIAANCPPYSGVLASIIGGIIHSITGGSDYTIITTQSQQILYIYNCIARYGLSSIPIVTIIGGIMSTLFIYFKLDRFIDLLPAVVNEAFVFSMGFFMIMGSLLKALDVGQITEYSKITIQENDYAIEKVIKTQTDQSIFHKLYYTIKYYERINLEAFSVYVLFTIALYFCFKKYPTLPWYVISCIAGIFIGYSNFFNIKTIKSEYGELKFKLFDFSHFNNLSLFFDIRIYVDTFPICLIGIVGTIIAAKHLDNLSNTKSDKKKEIIGSALANVGAGFFGGMPIFQSIVYSDVNYSSGATHKLANFYQSILMFLFSLLIYSIFEYIPFVLIYSQLTIIGTRMMHFDYIQKIYETNIKSFVIACIILIVSMIKDPIIGLIFGLFCYLIVFSTKLIKPWEEILISNINNKNEQNDDDPFFKDSDKFKNSVDLMLADIPQDIENFVVYRIVGLINFMNLKEHQEKLKSICGDNELIIVISLRYVYLNDIECVDSLKSLISNLEKERKEQRIKCKGFKLTGIKNRNKEKFGEIFQILGEEAKKKLEVNFEKNE